MKWFHFDIIFSSLCTFPCIRVVKWKYCNRSIYWARNYFRVSLRITIALSAFDNNVTRTWKPYHNAEKCDSHIYHHYYSCYFTNSCIILNWNEFDWFVCKKFYELMNMNIILTWQLNFEAKLTCFTDKLNFRVFRILKKEGIQYSIDSWIKT